MNLLMGGPPIAIGRSEALPAPFLLDYGHLQND